MFRKLRANEIECRVKVIRDHGLSLLLYKDARCDQNILDETVGPLNWERFHSRDNRNCTVSIWDSEKQLWVSKEDTGTESNTEKEKGLASDSFKRACFNWGIGRELYTAPFIWIPARDCKIVTGKNGKPACNDRFCVASIGYDDKTGEITGLKIVNKSTGAIVFSLGEQSAPDSRGTQRAATNRDRLIRTCKSRKLDLAKVALEFGLSKESTDEDYGTALSAIMDRIEGRQ